MGGDGVVAMMLLDKCRLCLDSSVVSGINSAWRYAFDGPTSTPSGRWSPSSSPHDLCQTPEVVVKPIATAFWQCSRHLRLLTWPTCSLPSLCSYASRKSWLPGASDRICPCRSARKIRVRETEFVRVPRFDPSFPVVPPRQAFSAAMHSAMSFPCRFHTVHKLMLRECTVLSYRKLSRLAATTMH